MTKQEKTKLILDALKIYTPISIDGFYEKEWFGAIRKGLDSIEKQEERNGD